MPSEFQWNDAVVKDFYNYCYFNVFKQPTFPEEMIEKFKQSKIKERITVSVFNGGMAGGDFHFRLNRAEWKVPIEKNEAIKQAIESILNNEQPKVTPSDIVDDWMNKTHSWRQGRNAEFIEKLIDPQPLSGELITKEECERREKRAFHGARFGMKRIEPASNISTFYPTYEDYQQSLK